MSFLTGYNGIFIDTKSNNKFLFKETITNEDDFIQITIAPGAYEIECLNNEIRRIIIDNSHYNKDEYPFMIRPNFSTLGSITEKSLQGPTIGFVFDDNIGNLVGFHETILYKEYHLLHNPVDMSSFNNFFLESDFAKGMIFKGKRSGFIHNWTMAVNPGCKYAKKIAGGNTWYMMETKDAISSISLKLKHENIDLVSFNGQSISFRLSIKEVCFSTF